MAFLKSIILLLVALPAFVACSVPSRAADNTPFLGEMEQRRQQILLRIEQLQDLKSKTQESLHRAKAIQAKARKINDDAALQVATQAASRSTEALDRIRQALWTEQGNLNRINNVLDQKERILANQSAKRVLVRKVPNPMQMPTGSWLRYVESDRAGLIMDAIEVGNGNLDDAIDYLDGQIIEHGGNRNSESALSYLEGLRTSYIAADAEYRRKDKGGRQTGKHRVRGVNARGRRKLSHTQVARPRKPESRG